MKFKKLHYISTLLVAAIVTLTTMSNSGGISGQSVQGCNNGGSCHAATANAATVVTITGLPATYTLGNTYNLSVSVTNITEVAGGFDLSVNVGSLGILSAGNTLVGTQELRHTAPKAMTGGTVSWTFSWTAPATGSTTAIFNVAGNAVNLNGINDPGDLWNTATINVPPNPTTTAPTITVGAVTGLTGTTATINGTVNANGSSTTVTVEYGLTVAYGTSVAATPGTVTGTTATAVSAALSSLLPGTTYHYRIKGVNGIGTTNSPDNTFTTPAMSPTITVSGPTGITNTGATINGTVNANGATTTSMSIQYGTTIAYGSTATPTPSSVSGTTATAISATLSGLAGATTYHYRIVATNSAGTTTGTDNTFITLPDAPTVVVGTPSGITSTLATLNGTVNANGGTATVTIDWGLTTAYGTNTATTPGSVTGSTATAVLLNLSGLAPVTTYHYRINATNAGGTTNSPDNTFTTLATVAAPTVVVGTPSLITFNSATINGTVNANNANASVTVEYGTTLAYGSVGVVTPNPVTGITVTSITSALSGLVGSTTYHYRIVATNSVGTTNSPDNTFTTAPTPTAPSVVVGAPTGITSSAAVLHGTVNANNASTSVSIEYGLTTAYGTAAVVTPNTVTGNTATAISSNLSGLLPLTTYHYRINATNSIGTTQSADATFTTLTNVGLPIVTVGSPTLITANSATINGAVNAVNASTAVTVEYGTTTAYGSTFAMTPSPITGNVNTLVSAALSGLLGATTYHYRIVATNSAGTTNSPDAVFTTLTPPGLPVVTLSAPTSITSTSAVLNGVVNATNATTTITVEYGLTATYGTTLNMVPSTATGLTNTPVLASLTLLTPSTVYHYRIKAVNSVGTVTSPDATFTTLNPFSLPDIILLAPSNISYNRGVVNATVNANNSNASVSVEYGPTTSYGSSINAAPSLVSGTTPTTISATINNLQPTTVYHYRVKATNAAGTVYSADDIIETTHGVSVASIEEGGYRLYPNPAYDQLMLTTKGNATVTIEGTTIDGRAITLPYRKVAADQYQIDIANLNAGIYLIILKSNGQSFTSRFSKM